MENDEILAVILVAAAAILLILTIILLCIVVYSRKRDKKPIHADIPEPPTRYDESNTNYALEEHDANVAPKTGDNVEWPGNYEMHVVSHSYAFPVKGQESSSANPSLGGSTRSKTESSSYVIPETANYTTTTTTTTTNEIHHKTFSEQIEKDNPGLPVAMEAHVTQPYENKECRPESVSSSTGIWKYNRAPSETTSQYSTDRHSVTTNSTIFYQSKYTQSGEKEQSYYSSFKSGNLSVASSTAGSAENIIVTKRGKRHRIYETNSVPGTQEKKVFTFKLG